MTRKSSSPRLLLILTMATFGTVGLFVRMIPLTSAEIAFSRALLALCGISFYLYKGRQPLQLKAMGRSLSMLLLSGALMGANWVVLFEAYRHTTVSVATLTYYVAPIIVTGMSALFLKERMSRLQLFCLMMSLAGFALMLNPAGAGAGNHLLGAGLGFAAAILYASVVMINRFTRGVSGVHRTLVQFAAAIVVLLPYILLNGGFRFERMNATGLAALLTLGLVHTALTYCVYFTVIQRMQGREIAILSYIDPLVAVLTSALFLREAMGPLQLTGGLFILVFTYLSERGAGKRAAKP